MKKPTEMKEHKHGYIEFNGLKLVPYVCYKNTLQWRVFISHMKEDGEIDSGDVNVIAPDYQVAVRMAARSWFRNIREMREHKALEYQRAKAAKEEKEALAAEQSVA